MNGNLLPAPFENPVHDAQQAFRALLSATSRPGTIQPLPLPRSAPAPFSRAMCAIALTLFDDTTSIWLDTATTSAAVLHYLRFHTGAKIAADAMAANFAVIGEAQNLSDLKGFSVGDSAYPDRAATVIVQLLSLTGGPEVSLSGPGIETAVIASPVGLAEDFWRHWNQNSDRYPCGLDMFLTDGSGVMGLPRTTRARV